MITVFTPTYNRAHLLPNAYNSLLKQTNKDFEWLIIDDGSTDNTNEIVDKFIEENRIKIRYYKKTNGGKHTAINYGINKAKGELTIILDSDDELVNNAIEIINKYWMKYKNNKKIGALSFIKINKNGSSVTTSFTGTEIISNNITFRYNNNIKGDMAEVYRTDILKKYPFPIYNNEKFLSEAIVWNKIALKYDTVYINEPLYICEYLNDGLSRNHYKLVYNNPIGARENALFFTIKEFNFKIRLKNTILYDGFAITNHDKIKSIITNSNNKVLSTLLLPFGYVWYFKLKKEK